MANAGTCLALPEAYRADGRDHIFPSGESFEWFVRKNRQELVAASALLKPTKRWLVNPEMFDRAVLVIGARKAARLDTKD